MEFCTIPLDWLLHSGLLRPLMAIMISHNPPRTIRGLGGKMGPLW